MTAPDWTRETCGTCAIAEAPKGAVVPPILIWVGGRLEEPRKCQLFDVVIPLPEHPSYDRMKADKLACTQHQIPNSPDGENP